MPKNAARNIVAVVDYGAGNIRSVARALEWVVEAAGLHLAVHTTAEPEEVARATRIVLPGQGAFKSCMDALPGIDGMLEALERRVRKEGAPFLGICVGMQLLADRGLEHGEHAGLGWIPGEVRPLEARPGLKVPHMGWNTVTPTPAGVAHPVLEGVPAGEYFYFVHSYAMHCADARDVLATADYGARFPCAVGRDTILGTQFHPEKSQHAGLALLDAFVRWRP